MMKNNTFKKLISALALISLTSFGVNAAGRYGFSDTGFANAPCGLANTLFPLSFKYVQGKGDTVEMRFNVFYVHDDIDGMDDYVDFYTSEVGGQQYWPTVPLLAKGQDTPQCTGSTDCVTAGKGGINKGVSDYARLVQAYPGDGNLKIIADKAPTNGSRYKYLIDVRKLKLLRVEVFTPYTGNTAMHIGYVEPAYFEYVKDGNNWLKLSVSGSTAPSNDPSKPDYSEAFTATLPKKINLNLLSDIQIDLTGDSSFADKRPSVTFVNLKKELVDSIPATCK